jgi:PAB-dependent poly(A)-specific ribonuclease subunit 2
MSNEPQPSTSFPSILSSSITRETIARLPCSSCKQNTHVRVRRVLPESATLPPILVVNAGVRTADELDVWRDGREGPNSRFLSGRFRMRRGPEGLAQISAEGKAREGDVEYALKASPVPMMSEDVHAP